MPVVDPVSIKNPAGRHREVTPAGRHREVTVKSHGLGVIAKTESSL